jgi:hypothetical protein
MHATKITALLGIAATTAAVLAPTAGAADAAATAKVTGAYAYISHTDASINGHMRHDVPFATLVFKTDHQLPRRYDGLIRAGASLGGQSASVGSVAGKASRCYSISVRIKPDNTITGTVDGKLVNTKAKAGSKLKAVITPAKDAAEITRSVTLRKQRAGDAGGAPLSC